MEFLVAHGGSLLFYLFGAIAVVGALLVVGLRNPMYGAIALLSSFLAVAALFLLRHAEFVAGVQIFVYGGGIMVLFLFVIMLVNLHRLHENRLFLGQWPIAVVVAILFIGLLAVGAMGYGPGSANPEPGRLVGVGGEALGNSQAVAWMLYRDYLLPFEIASLFLLVAMIGAVVLGRRR
jgi:NADH-quinone oxidoreductase subunit J